MKKSDPLDTPVMRQYLEIKSAHPDAILFFRMGDFYEMFLEDAETAAPIMDVTLTRRQENIPMAGVPYHNVEPYIAKLLAAGRKVVVAEQSPDPANPKLMRRVVTRVISAGTVLEESLMHAASASYLAGISWTDLGLGIAFCDVSTGAFFSMQTTPAEHGSEILFLRDVCARYAPREVLVPSPHMRQCKEALHDIPSLTPVEEWRSSPTEGGRRLQERFGDLRPLGYAQGDPALGAAGLVLYYVATSFPGIDVRLNAPSMRSQGSVMKLDEQTIGNLDLVWNSHENGTKRTLFGILDFCRTQPGRRFLREAVIQPLTDRTALDARLESVDLLAHDHDLRTRLSQELANVYDLERISSRIAAKRAFPRDFPAVRHTIEAAGRIAQILKERIVPLAIPGRVIQLAGWISAAVVDEPPAALGKGPFIKPQVRRDLDDARQAREKGAAWILEFEAEERKRSGISNLRVKYNRVAGYFIEVTKSQAANVPSDYVRKQTLLGQERYSTPRLGELEEAILGAEEIVEKAEAEEFERLCSLVSEHGADIAALMMDLARIDFLSALAESAVRYKWVRPRITATRSLVIVDGRHPVVEAFLPPGEPFISNSVLMGDEERLFALLTGPNMAGKSTYIRQTALIQILMQIGSFVPASRAELSVADRVFTRIGASDNITRGESTFYVEMLETARILHQCTDESLVIMDEVGRGTSTYDGLSLAWAIVEHLTGDAIRPRVLFATHYHELTVLESRSGVFNVTMDVREKDGRVVFLRKVREGAADDSYGIHVARLAGIPEGVLKRAEEKLSELEEELARKEAALPARKARPAATRRIAALEDQPGLF